MEEKINAEEKKELEKKSIYVKDNFWKKIKKTMGKVPFVADAIALYFCAIDTKTPLMARITAFSALAYFISPIDAIPDIIPGGFVDDAAAVSTAIIALSGYITDEHRLKAENWLNSNK